MTRLLWVYVTARDRPEALRIARKVVGERLAACANVFPVRSCYWWEGELEEGSEVAIVLKTRAALLDGLVSRIKQLHSYKVPCVVALPIAGGNPDFLRWVAEETSTRRPRRSR